MTTARKKLAAIAASVASVALLVVGAGASASADELPPQATLYTGEAGSGTPIPVDLDQVGVCQTLSTPALSYLVIANRSLDVFYNPDCRKGLPGSDGDLYFRTGTLGSGTFPFPAVSFRVRTAA